MGISSNDIISKKSQDAFQAYTHNKSLNVNWVRGLTNLSAEAAQEYEDRFLIELIQNGYDAHSAHHGEGRLCIRLVVDEGDHGTLYIGNTGDPFRESNFNAICDIAQSDKKPGNGIGNKGVGFRSVLHVCDLPEIYSAKAPRTDLEYFDGFCFGFATREDYERLAGGNIELLQSALADIAPQFLPVFRPEQNENIRHFAKDGMATVIRLPIQRESGAEVVRRQMQSLLGSKQPVLLFLDRISELIIEEIKGESCLSRTCLRRCPHPIASLRTADELEVVELVANKGQQGAEVDTELIGRYVLVRRKVDGSRLATAIQASIEEGFLDRKFSEWEDDAYVSVAARVDANSDDHCMYTFLPMPDAASPFAGYLNAPFAPKLDRKSVNRKIPLNNMLLTIAAEVCAENLPELKEEKLGISPSVIIDFLCWKPDDFTRIETAFGAAHGELEKYPIIPIVETKECLRWGSIDNVFDWETTYQCLTIDNLAQIAGVELINREFGVNRVKRLNSLLESIGWSTIPTPAGVAGWVEEIAQELAEKPFKKEIWDGFYDDLASYFSKDGRVLEGKKILIDSNRVLRVSGPYKSTRLTSDAPSVFFPPASGRAEEDEDVPNDTDISIPETVSKYVCYLHPDLKWRYLDGTRYRKTQARDFLQRSNLVLRYDTENLLEHLSKVAQQATNESLQGEILSLAFRLFRASNAKESLNDRKLKFSVPTNGGFRPATESHFSAGWKGTSGGLLEKLIRETRGVSVDLGALELRLLLKPGMPPFEQGEEYEWEKFLKAIGVKDGLWPSKLSSKGTSLLGSELAAELLSERFDAGPNTTGLWDQAIGTSGFQLPKVNATYRIQEDFSYLPGQEEYARFSKKGKDLFAHLVIKGLGSWDDEHFKVELVRSNFPGLSNRHYLPSPLKAFIRHASWIPVKGAAGNTEFVVAAEAWHFEEDDSEEPPRFMPLIAREFRERISFSALCLARLGGTLGIRTFSDPTSKGDLLVFMGELVKRSLVLDEHVSTFRKVYSKTWDDIVKGLAAYGDPFTGSTALQWLVIERGGALCSVGLAKEKQEGEDDNIYVSDSVDNLARHLLNDLRRPLLIAEERNGTAIASILREHMGDRVKLASEAELVLTTQGSPFYLRETADPLFSNELLWLKETISVLIDVKSRVPTHHTEKAQSEVRTRLDRSRVVWADSIEIRIDGIERDLPSQFEGILFLDHEEWPTLLIRSEKKVIDWDILIKAAKPMMQLIDRGSLGDSLQATLLRLARGSNLWDESPEDSVLAMAMGTDIETIGRVKNGFRASFVAVVERLYPVICHWAGKDAADQFEKESHFDGTVDCLNNLLQPHARALQVDVTILAQEAITALTLADLRDKLNIEYESFNLTLEELRPRYRPFHNIEGHRNSFSFYKQKRRESVLVALRSHFMPDFKAGKDLHRYIELRRMNSVVPDPAWLDKYDIPPESEMKARIDVWLTESGVLPVEGGQFEVGALERIRTENRKLATTCCSEIRRLAIAWSRKKNCAAPPVWDESDPTAVLIDLMEGCGFFDFEILTRQTVLTFIVKAGHWPEEMPQSMSPDEIGLTDEDLRTEEQIARRERNERERQRQTIEIEGKRYAASATECQALIDAILSTITPEFLKRAGKSATLDEVAVGGTKTARTGRTRNTPSPEGTL